MLFRKKMPHACSFCRHAVPVRGKEYLCDKRGVVGADYKCAKFRYDPLRRVPAPKLKVSVPSDFRIDD